MTLKLGRALGACSAACFAALVVAACASFGENPGVVDGTGKSVKPLFANRSLQVTRGLAIGVDAMVFAATLNWLVDPLAPNWQVQQVALGEDRMRIALRKKRFASGGDGEAAQLFARRAEQASREGGYAGYTVLQYSEGVESTLPVAERVAQGVIRFDR